MLPRSIHLPSALARAIALSGVSLFLLAVVCPLGSVGFAAPAPPELAEKIDRLFAKWDTPQTPGVIVAIAKDGETIHARGYGMANLEHGIALSPETVSESGSVAKQFTAAAVVLLAQRGKLSLDDPMRKHLPEMAHFGDAITVRMLLNHTSGLRDIHGLFDLIGRPSYSSMHTNAEVLQVMSRQRQLNFEPGTEYLYSNGAYILAALVVERASGKPFGVFCREQIFEPRGMTRTQWRDDFTAIIPGRAAGYAPRPAGGYRIDMPYSNLAGNGGLLTTVGDLLKWNASFENATGEWAEVVRALETPSTLKNGRVLDYALGLKVERHGDVTEISHGGATSGYRTFLTRFPEKRLSIALLGNAADFNGAAVARSIARLMLDLPPRSRPAAAAVSSLDPSTLAGRYHSAQIDTTLTLTSRDGKLFFGGELIPTAARSFVNASGESTFVFDEAQPPSLTITSTNEVVTFSRFTPAQPAAADLAAYAGKYYSEELDVTHTVSVRDGRLSLVRWPGPALRSEPTFKDGFWFGRAWHATFTRDAHGNLTGYELTNGRCRRVRFVRQ